MQIADVQRRLETEQIPVCLQRLCIVGEGLGILQISDVGAEENGTAPPKGERGLLLSAHGKDSV